MHRRIKALGGGLASIFGSAATSRGAGACCVAGCTRPDRLVVADDGVTQTVLCGDHVRQWVESQACHRVAGDVSGSADRTLGSWARARAACTAAFDPLGALPTRAGT